VASIEEAKELDVDKGIRGGTCDGDDSNGSDVEYEDFSEPTGSKESNKIMPLKYAITTYVQLV
jgi:hypothetical protein